MRRSRKPLYVYWAYPGFESLPLRWRGRIAVRRCCSENGRAHQFDRMARSPGSAVGDLLAAGDAGGGDDHIGDLRRRGSGTAAGRRSASRARNARIRSRTSPPCRNSRRRSPRRWRRESAATTRPSPASQSPPSRGSGRARRSAVLRAPTPDRDEGRPRRSRAEADRAPDGPARRRRARAGRPGAGRGTHRAASARTRARSRRWARPAPRRGRGVPTRASAIERAWSSSPLDRLARPQQPLLSRRTCQPARSSSSTQALPIAGSVNVVNESARKTTSPRGHAPRTGPRCANHRIRVSRSNCGSGRCAAIPNRASSARRSRECARGGSRAALSPLRSG